MPQNPQQMQQNNPAASSMAEYLANYGTRLQSLLQGALTPESIQVANPTPQQPQQMQQPGAPTSRLEAAAQPMQQRRPQQQEGPDSFRAQWGQTSKEQQAAAVDRLESDLSRGNQTIDSAYDDMVKQLGTRPEADHKLTREEKGMMLMEFGLSLMANSSSQAYGTDLAGAIGASGLEAVRGHRKRRQHERDTYDRSRLEIEGSRAQSKARFAEQSALEGARYTREAERDRRREEREDEQVVSVVSQPDNSVVGVTRGGRASKLEVDGQPVRSRPPARAGGGAGGRGFESDRRYQLYMDTYGKDAEGNPLEGEALRKVKERALAFSADPKAATLSDSEMRTMAERSADAFQKSNWSLFRDMTPDQALAWKNDAAEANYKRLKEGRDLEMQPPAAPAKPAAPKGGAPRSRLEVPTRPAPRSGKVATPKALEALRAHPDRAQEFLAKYGYLPTEFHRYLK